MTVCDLLTNLVRKPDGVIVGYTTVLDAADRLTKNTPACGTIRSIRCWRRCP